jgi:uncharacterized integral membrane protein
LISFSQLVCSAAFLAAAVICSTASDSSAAAAWALNLLVLLGAAGLGVSLVQIHIYMTPVKRTLQVRLVYWT